MEKNRTDIYCLKKSQPRSFIIFPRVNIKYRERSIFGIFFFIPNKNRQSYFCCWNFPSVIEFNIYSVLCARTAANLNCAHFEWNKRIAFFLSFFYYLFFTLASCHIGFCSHPTIETLHTSYMLCSTCLAWIIEKAHFKCNTLSESILFFHSNKK